MRAIMIRRFGGPEVLELAEVPTPEPGPGQVRVAVYASGTNPVETGNRADGSWAGLELPAVLGYDASGVVDAVGPGVVDARVGDEVFYMPDFLRNRWGSHADYHVADAAILAPKPPRLSHVEAASLPLAGGTAYATIAGRLAVGRGEWLLIHGAAGGVGSLAVQIAVARGARVLASASARHHAWLASLGVTACIDYRERDVAEAALELAGGPIDAVADFASGEALAGSLSALRPHGRAATVVSLATAEPSAWDAAFDRNVTLHAVLVRPDRGALLALAAMVEQGSLRPVIDRVLPLEDVAEAHRRLETGHGRGKIVLRLRGDAG
jgi:NADPH:quinone reductase